MTRNRVTATLAGWHRPGLLRFGGLCGSTSRRLVAGRSVAAGERRRYSLDPRTIAAGELQRDRLRDRSNLLGPARRSLGELVAKRWVDAADAACGFRESTPTCSSSFGVVSSRAATSPRPLGASAGSIHRLATSLLRQHRGGLKRLPRWSKPWPSSWLGRRAPGLSSSLRRSPGATAQPDINEPGAA